MSVPKVWFHVDMDAFYAAVEQRDNPNYRGKPLIIGGNPQSRGVVSTASYEARKFGVHSAMPTSQAYRLCPQGIFIFPRMDAYLRESRKIMKLFEDFTPVVVPVSVDEAFLDMSGTSRLFGPPREAGIRIKQRVFEQTGLTISVGIGSTKLIAKMASGLNKPDGLTEVPSGGEEDFVRGLEIRDLWGVGKKSQERLAELNIQSVAMLQQIPQQNLKALFGEAGGSYLYQVSRGIDPGIYSGKSKSHSISNEHTFARDVHRRESLEQVLLELSHTIFFRLLGENKASKVIVLKLRYGDFSTTTAQLQLDHPVRSVEETYRAGLALLAKRWNGSSPVRLLGLGYALVQAGLGSDQQDLFGEATLDLKRKKVEQTILGLRNKYSSGIIKLGGLMSDPERADQGPSAGDDSGRPGPRRTERPSAQRKSRGNPGSGQE